MKTITTAHATPAPCRTIAECREAQDEARENIADMLEEAEELGEDIAAIQNQINDLRVEISQAESDIFDQEAEIDSLRDRMDNLRELIRENRDLLEDTEERIDVLIEEIAERMRITQIMNNSNSMLTILSEAENFIDFIRRTRTFNQMAVEDLALNDELTDLVELQENLLVELGEQSDELYARMDEFEARLAVLEQEQENLTTLQINLIENEAQVRDALYRLNAEREVEEELLASLEEAEEILRRTPPPPAPGSGSSVGGMPQTPNESGLAHPLPGAIVTSRFGMRWGAHHAGIDLAVPGNNRAPILAAAAGTVTLAEWHDSMGWYVIISHNIDGRRVDTVYAHLRYRPPVSPGDTVEQGEEIGTKGSTGFTFGNGHLHFEVHPGGFSWTSPRGTNPENWIVF